MGIHLKFRKISLLIFYALVVNCAGAQPCQYFPADCPDNAKESANDSDVCITNMILPQEISMQRILREYITELMNEIARKNKWTVYPFFEEAGAGIMVDNKPLSYPYRRPYQCSFSFIFIVNEDSLHAWQNWYNNDLQNATNKVVDSYKQGGTSLLQDDMRQKNIDSANYYGDQKTKYMTNHMSAYQKALTTNDVKWQKTYENEMKRYDAKIEYFINKTRDKTTSDFSSSKKQFDDLELYKHKNIIGFRNASMIRVSFNMNDYVAIADDEEKKIVNQVSVPGSTLGILIHNNAPDEHEIFGQYLRSPDIALLLYGKWNLKQDQYHSYHSVYFADKKNTDMVTVKKIACDKVQTMVVHVEGSRNHINQFLQISEMQKIARLVEVQ
jgi:hypothetical protein